MKCIGCGKRVTKCPICGKRVRINSNGIITTHPLVLCPASAKTPERVMELERMKMENREMESTEGVE